MIWTLISVVAIGVVILLWALIQIDDINNCNQDCNQGRNCDCGDKDASST